MSSSWIREAPINFILQYIYIYIFFFKTSRVVRVWSAVVLSDPVSFPLPAALLNSGPREEAFSVIETWQLAGHIRAESGLAGGPAGTQRSHPDSWRCETTGTCS
jgi:hypothetical protein